MLLLLLLLFLRSLGQILIAEGKRTSSSQDSNISALAKQLEKETDLFEIERLLAHIEYLRFQSLVSRLQSQGYEIQGFYHTSKWQNHWARVIQEQLKVLDGKRKFPNRRSHAEAQRYLEYPSFDSQHNNYYENYSLPYAAYDWDDESTYTSLFSITHQLNLNIAGENLDDYKIIKQFVQSLDLKSSEKIRFNFNITIGRYDYDDSPPEKKKEYDRRLNVSSGEYSTITQLHQYCQRKNQKSEKALVYYFHNKGACCSKSLENYGLSDPVANWREYMNTLILEFPSICLRAITSKKYLACGVENQDGHFSGNFWWADCAHVALLPPLRNRYDFTESEFFVLRGHENHNTKKNFGYKCAYSIFNCKLNLYDFECPREKYREQVLLQSIPTKLRPNNVYFKDDWTHKCRDIVQRKQPYREIKDEVRKMVGGRGK